MLSPSPWTGEGQERAVQRAAAIISFAAERVAAIDDRLAHSEMLMTLRRDLGKVGDAQDLPCRSEFAQLAPDHFRGGTADAGINLVEHHHRHVVGADCRDFDGEADPCQFAAGRDLAQRSSRLARIRADHEFDVVAPGQRKRAIIGRLDLDLERARDREFAQ